MRQSYIFFWREIIFSVFILLATFSCRAQPATPVFLHFFDWFHTTEWQEDKFVDPLDWQAIGLRGEDRSSEDFYFKQFQYIKSLGIDAIAWEYHLQSGAPATYPAPEAIRALERSQLKIAPFYDWGISAKVRNQPGEQRLPTLSNPGSIRPDSATANLIIAELGTFFQKVPRHLQARDKKGRTVIFVFGYGFDDSDPDPVAWQTFGEALRKGVAEFSEVSPMFYWTAKNSIFQEHLFLHHRENFTPFQFVLDTPQSQFGHESVTWNFGFDNLGIQKRDAMQRVIRLDLRYIKEMGWMSKATDPSLVFVYSWNEPFEGSMLLPTQQWGDTKAQLAKAYIRRMKIGRDPLLPKTLLIVDDLDEYWKSRKNDWHLVMLRELLLYPMRRFVPQADVRMSAEVTPELLDQYSYVIDLTTSKVTQVSSWLIERMNSHRIMIFDPLASSTGSTITAGFAKLGKSPTINREVLLGKGKGKLFVRDDVNRARVCQECQVKLTVDLPVSGKVTATVPLVVTKGDDVWVNAYTNNQEVLASAFASLYGRPLGVSILYGEAYASQRLEIDGKTGQVTHNRLNRYSINDHWDIPANIDWHRMPAEVSPEHYNFIFGVN
ncbi:hypothetical protein CR155_18515 [Pollutimonas nitritireducens]|uniref:Glycoside hydrolase family 42 N-terminal domain-containing protein n=2 Tax=Pollutimonas nitritireducens TaxID=2045209 RepID=A0A2N4UBU3_9BURK|nr:hypothetical protein CR155_18515 [Pollutimonas nitritireducens]